MVFKNFKQVQEIFGLEFLMVQKIYLILQELQLKRFTPKFRAGQQGSVNVEGWGNPFGYADTTTMTSGTSCRIIKCRCYSR